MNKNDVATPNPVAFCRYCRTDVDDGYNFCRDCVEFADDLRISPEVLNRGCPDGGYYVPRHYIVGLWAMFKNKTSTLTVQRLSSPHVVSQFDTVTL